MKAIDAVLVWMVVWGTFFPVQGAAMGWTPPTVFDGGEDTGPVSAPEPGMLTLISVAASAGAGYYFGRRKK